MGASPELFVCSMGVSLWEFIMRSAGWHVRTGLTSLNRWGGFHQDFQQCLTGGHSLPLTKLISLIQFACGWSTSDDPIERGGWPVWSK